MGRRCVHWFSGQLFKPSFTLICTLSFLAVGCAQVSLSQPSDTGSSEVASLDNKAKANLY